MVKLLLPKAPVRKRNRPWIQERTPSPVPSESDKDSDFSEGGEGEDEEDESDQGNDVAHVHIYSPILFSHPLSLILVDMDEDYEAPQVTRGGVRTRSSHKKKKKAIIRTKSGRAVRQVKSLDDESDVSTDSLFHS